MKVPLDAAYVCLTILVCGCGAHVLDAGSNDAGVVAPPSGVRWFQPPSNDLDNTCSPGSTSVVGSWLGHFDNYVFPSGSNEIRIDLTNADPAIYPNINAPCGKIVFGAGDPPPLPTDPAAFYPPGSDPVTTVDLGDAGGIERVPRPQRIVYEGFRYDFAGGVDDAHIDAQHLELGVMTGQIYKAWCEIQLSYFQGYAAAVSLYPYDCVPPHTASRDQSPDGGCELFFGEVVTGGIHFSWSWADAAPIGCAQLELCRTACQCQPNGCTLPAFSPDVLVDIQFQGDAGSGNASFPLDGIQAFTLQRAP